MVTSLSMRSNQTSKNTSREELRDLLGKSPAALRFLTLFKTPLDGFVGNILEIFKAPKAEGVDFEFANGKRTEFLNLIDPSSIIGNIGPFTFAPAAKGPMVPDDPDHRRLTESGAGLPARDIFDRKPTGKHNQPVRRSRRSRRETPQ